mmetsp:Transcript_11996/g.32300  ORF Transcript_11996/g.32300 Transcript_11996/m.32300 type:complete len:284 (+) Transcript_11996:52-903(+)
MNCYDFDAPDLGRELVALERHHRRRVCCSDFERSSAPASQSAAAFDPIWSTPFCPAPLRRARVRSAPPSTRPERKRTALPGEAPNELSRARKGGGSSVPVEVTDVRSLEFMLKRRRAKRELSNRLGPDVRFAPCAADSRSGKASCAVGESSSSSETPTSIGMAFLEYDCTIFRKPGSSSSCFEAPSTSSTASGTIASFATFEPSKEESSCSDTALVASTPTLRHSASTRARSDAFSIQFLIKERYVEKTCARLNVSSVLCVASSIHSGGAVRCGCASTAAAYI